MKHRIAILGPLGTYTHEAAYSRFNAAVEYQECGTIKDVFNAVSETADLGVIPHENSIYGAVVETYDMLRMPCTRFVQGEITLQVQHCLLVRKGVQLQDIRMVLSHEQAIGQCQVFLKAHVPSATMIKTSSTAAAARKLLESDADCAAIGSRICTKMFDGLEVLYEGIQDVADNFTRFYVLAKGLDTVIPPRLAVVIRCQRALIRVSSPTEAQNAVPDRTMDLTQLFLLIRLKIIRIEHRPSATPVPFHDAYFLEVEQREDDTAQGCDWLQIVYASIRRIRETNTSAQLIGMW